MMPTAGAVAAIAAAAVAGLPAALAGCGSSDAPSEEQRVTDTVRLFLRAEADGETAKACGLLTGAGRGHLIALVRQATGTAGTGLTCEQAGDLIRLAAGTRTMAALGDAEVRAVRVSGSRATALVVDGEAFDQRRVRLRLTADGWRIDAVPDLLG